MEPKTEEKPVKVLAAAPCWADPDRMREWIHSRPKWAHALIGLAIIPIVLVLAPLIGLWCLGEAVWDLTFGGEELL